MTRRLTTRVRMGGKLYTVERSASKVLRSIAHVEKAASRNYRALRYVVSSRNAEGLRAVPGSTGGWTDASTTSAAAPDTPQAMALLFAGINRAASSGERAAALQRATEEGQGASGVDSVAEFLATRDRAEH